MCLEYFENSHVIIMRWVQEIWREEFWSSKQGEILTEQIEFNGIITFILLLLHRFESILVVVLSTFFVYIQFGYLRLLHIFRPLDW